MHQKLDVIKLDILPVGCDIFERTYLYKEKYKFKDSEVFEGKIPLPNIGFIKEKLQSFSDRRRTHIYCSEVVNGTISGCFDRNLFFSISDIKNQEAVLTVCLKEPLPFYCDFLYRSCLRKQTLHFLYAIFYNF